ncbi:MAG: zinc ribbon domain-containing protein [Candidatus Methanomethylicia archaeon]
MLIVRAASTTPITATTPTKTTVALPPRGFDVLSFLPYIILAVIAIVVILLAAILLRRRKPSPPPAAPKPPEPVEPARRYCMHCGSVMPSDALFCPKCGKQPPGGPDTKTCPNCGSVINLVASYCPKCGAAQPKG